MVRPPKSSKQVDALKHEAARRRNIPTAEMESFFRRDEDASPMPPKHYPRARPLAEGATRTAEEPRVPELATPPPGTMPSSTAARVACIASSM
jgi:adenine-specific DNA-methyltransferase